MAAQEAFHGCAAEECLVILSCEEHRAGDRLMLVFNRNQENVVLVCYCEAGIGSAEIDAAENRSCHGIGKLGAQFPTICPAMQIAFAILVM